MEEFILIFVKIITNLPISSSNLLVAADSTLLVFDGRRRLINKRKFTSKVDLLRLSNRKNYVFAGEKGQGGAILDTNLTVLLPLDKTYTIGQVYLSNHFLYLTTAFSNTNYVFDLRQKNPLFSMAVSEQRLVLPWRGQVVSWNQGDSILRIGSFTTYQLVTKKIPFKINRVIVSAGGDTLLVLGSKGVVGLSVRGTPLFTVEFRYKPTIWPKELVCSRLKGQLVFIHPQGNALYIRDLRFSLVDSIKVGSAQLLKLYQDQLNGLGLLAFNKEFYRLDSSGTIDWHFTASKLQGVLFLSNHSIRFRNGTLWYATGNNRYYIYKNKGTLLDSGLIRNTQGLNTGDVVMGDHRYIFRQRQVNRTDKLPKEIELWNFKGQFINSFSFGHPVQTYFLDDDTVIVTDGKTQTAYLQVAPEKAKRTIQHLQARTTITL